MTQFFDRVGRVVISWIEQMVQLDRQFKLVMLIAMDALLCVASVWIAFSLRLGEWVLWSPGVIAVMAVALLLWLPLFHLRGIYRSILRFMGSRTMVGIATACVAMAGIMAAIFTINSVAGVPRTIAFIQPMVFMVLLAISRLTARYVFFDLLNRRRFAGRQEMVLIYGAGTAGRQLALSLRHEPGMVLRGYIDDDERLVGKSLDGVNIHDSRDLAKLIARFEIDTVLLAVPRVSRKQREAIVGKFQDISVRVLTLPAMAELVDGSVTVNDLRHIEVEDLLGRDAVPPDELLLHKTVTDRIVLVTGAGGSIGSELCRQIAELDPKQLVLVEMTEHALYAIDGELRELQRSGRINPDLLVHAELGNVADQSAVDRMFDRWRPETVFHAAAYKHVPLVEENVVSGMRNNIFGTYYCAAAADRVGTHHFILISTDKAVRPTNVMGASKRVCEQVLQAFADNGSATCFTMVRFGNVLGSSGSVVPRFARQIRAGGPVTLTHRDVTRYFMTIPEAAQLVIQAGAMAQGGEVYVLDMGEPVRIYDLARTMIHLSGLSVRDTAHPDGDIEICEIGLRKGEKLYEELLIGNAPCATRHPRIMQAREEFVQFSILTECLAHLHRVLSAGDREQALGILSHLVPEFEGEQSVNSEGGNPM